MNNELLEKAREAKTPEELLQLARENGKEMTAEEAEAIFKSISGSGEISDEEIENAVGGCGGSKWNPTYDCDALRPYCGWPGKTPYECSGFSGYSRWACKECGECAMVRCVPYTYEVYDGCEHAKKLSKLDCSNCKWHYHSPYGNNRC